MVGGLLAVLWPEGSSAKTLWRERLSVKAEGKRAFWCGGMSILRKPPVDSETNATYLRPAPRREPDMSARYAAGSSRGRVRGAQLVAFGRRDGFGYDVTWSLYGFSRNRDG